MTADSAQRVHRRILRRLFGGWLAAALIALLVAMAFAAPSIYYERGHGSACASCHEIWQPYTDWHSSTHRKVPCSDCHGDVLTLDAGFHLNNMRRVFTQRVEMLPKNRTSGIRMFWP